MFPIELLRALLALIGVGSAYMAGRTLAGVRSGQMKPARHFAWMVRAILCLAILAFRHTADGVMLGAWALSAVAYAGGCWQVSHAKPPEDLSHEIVPREP